MFEGLKHLLFGPNSVAKIGSGTPEDRVPIDVQIIALREELAQSRLRVKALGRIADSYYD